MIYRQVAHVLSVETFIREIRRAKVSGASEKRWDGSGIGRRACGSWDGIGPFGAVRPRPCTAVLL